MTVLLVECACRCGQQFPAHKNTRGKEVRYIKGHSKRQQKYFNQFSDKTKLCACGCKTEMRAFRANGYPTGPVKRGHHHGLTSTPNEKIAINHAQMEKSKNILINRSKRECKLKSAFCSNKQISPHHLNRDIFDTAKDNLIWLCYSHKIIAIGQNLWDLQSIRDEERHYYVQSNGRKKRLGNPKDIRNWK